jgi:hypothetical protein
MASTLTINQWQMNLHPVQSEDNLVDHV